MALPCNVPSILEGLFALGLCVLVTVPSRTSSATGGTVLARTGGWGNSFTPVGGAGGFVMQTAAESVRSIMPKSAGLSPWAAIPSIHRVDVGTTVDPASNLGTNASSRRAVVTKSALPPVGIDSGPPRPIWPESEVVLTVDSSYLALPYALRALQGALFAWSSQCEKLPKVTFRYTQELSAEQTPAENLGDHRLFFAPIGDVRAKTALAVTLVTADEGTNTIIDADILINGGHRFTDVTSLDQGQASNQFYDLQNVLTHEFGHWFGLDEDYEHPDATMYAYVFPGESGKRDLTEDDIMSVQMAQWQAEDPGATVVGCSLSRIRPRPLNGWVGWLVVAGLWLRGRRRRMSHQVT